MSAGARWIVAMLLLVAATAVAVGAVFGVWAKRQALETDPWVDTSERVLKDETVRAELSRELEVRVFQIPAVQQRIDSLSADDARALRATVREKATEVLGSPAALRAWRTANERAHRALLQFLDGDRDTVSINVRALVEEVLAEAGLPERFADDVPRGVTSLEIVREGELESARRAADIIRALAIVLPLLALVLYAAAILVAPGRLGAVAATGASLVLVALSVIVLRAAGERAVSDQLSESSRAKPAVEATYSIATSLLGSLAIVALVAGILAALVAVAVALIRTPGDGDDHVTRVMPPRAAR